MVEETSDIDVIDPEPPTEGGTELTVKFRLSTGKELKLTVKSTDTVYQVKKRIHAAENMEPSRQRFYFSGKLLTDKTRVEEAKLMKGFVVQVIISQPNPAPVDGWPRLEAFDLFIVMTWLRVSTRDICHIPMKVNKFLFVTIIISDCFLVPYADVSVICP